MSELTQEQSEILENEKKNLIVSASAGSGKTFVLISYITKLLINKRVPLRKMLILTFTRAAAGEMRERLNKQLLAQNKSDEFTLQQIDDLSIADISTIDAFCEKIIRRNIDKLELDESFKVLENPDEVKQKAFENALIKFAEQNEEMLSEIYYSFRKNKSTIYQTVLDLESFFSCQSEGSVDYFIENQPRLYEKAITALNLQLKNELNELISEITLAEDKFVIEPKYQLFCQTLINLLSLHLGEDFVSNVQNLKLVNLPSVPVVRGENRNEDLSNRIKNIRQKCKNFLDGFGKYNFTDPILLQKQKSGALCVALLRLYKVFEEEYSAIKQKLDVLDFVDIERYALSLMKNENLLAELQEKYDYIFVDEYQDTNRVQEAIIKPITAGGHFIAVGDPKQGIYGFRNATMEIMKDDILQFSHQDDGSAKYLTGNFRSDEKVLNFVNRIFEKVMTAESVGIDYKATSMLTGQMEFKKSNLPSVRVDIVTQEKASSQNVQKGIYSVKQDNLQTSDKNDLEIDAIIARIDDLLMQKIYDEKAEAFRSVEFDDIAVLLRNRSSLMEALSVKLSQKGYPCYADVKQSPAEEAEVQMLINLLKLLLNKENDIALISVMNSKLGGFTLDELAALRLAMPEKKRFCDIYKECVDLPKLAEFDNMLSTLKVHAQIKGLTSALSELFVQKDYFAYLKYQDVSKHIKVCNFLQDIKSHDLDFDIAGAISYFSEVGGVSRNALPSGAGIKIMTIHASKGLEFPIVILAGAGQKLEKPSQKSYLLNSNYGLTMPAYNELLNIKCTSPMLEQAKRENKRKEMIDEIMIFYVALTRAKNHLYIVGQENVENLIIQDGFDVLKSKNYLSMIGYAFGNQFIEKLSQSQSEKMGDWEFNIVSQVEDLKYAPQEAAQALLSHEIKHSLTQYFDYDYSGKKFCKINLKNSVTSLNSTAYKNVHKLTDEGGSIDIGNAYHEALKILDFSQIETIDDLNAQIIQKNNLFTPNYLDLIDRQLLFKNIVLIKSVVGSRKLYKEKQFVMSEKACEIFDCQTQDEVLVQGIVDLFALGENNILIDYKYTGQKNSEKILEKYRKQLDLYSRAIEKGFKIKIDKKYLLSLKNAELIEYFN